MVTLWGPDASVESLLRALMEDAAEAAADAHNLLSRVLWNATEDGVPAGLEDGLRATARRGMESLLSRTQFRHELSAQVYRTGRDAVAKVGRAVNDALARGASWRELATDVRQFISPDTPGGMSYAAKRLARTEINNAFHTTQVRLAAESPFVLGMEWHLSGAHPVPDECNDYAGEVFAPEKVPPKPHAQCMCFVTPTTVSCEEFVDRFVAGEYDEYVRSVQAGYNQPVPTPKPDAEKPLEPRETDDQILDRVSADPAHSAENLSIAQAVLRGETRQKIAADSGTSVKFITDRIKALDLPYAERVKLEKPAISGKIRRDHQRNIDRSLDDFVDQYPEMTASLGGVHLEEEDPNQTLKGEDTYAYYTPGNPNIYLTGKYFRDESAEELDARARVDAGVKWHPSNCTHGSSIFEHEFGHHLDFNLSTGARGRVLIELANAFNGQDWNENDYLHQWRKAREILPHKIGFEAWLFNIWIETNAQVRVSRYAATNSFEMMAELFAESRGKNPSKFAQIVAEHFRREFGPHTIPGYKGQQP